MDYLTTNKTAWDARTRVHLTSDFYDVAGFLRGNSSLREIELSELDVAGKSLLHLQCHFGLDTLSWARMGAKVIGVDLSEVAIAEARKLAQQTQLSAEFICSDVYSVVGKVEPQDIVFTSYGAIVWLPDLTLWAQTIAACLKPGGQFYMAEFHPAQQLFDGYSYFNRGVPDIEQEGTYTENAGDEQHTLMCWSHSLSEVINALLQAGLELAFFHEFAFSPYNCFAGLEAQADGRYVLKHQGQQVPLVYSISARKPA
ncbi:class I SAM-dependent methyltransferase [Shewanella xiamenensis]|uniref:class I SAM-dependent methyltransferase n=1 Tax=Shewanella xiamenensis TaxID=332186 RepID=UPI0035BAC651